jgi:voltage-gated potassium channel
MNAQPGMRGHVIVCGCGPTALFIIEELEANKKRAALNPGLRDVMAAADYIVIDHDEEQIAKTAARVGAFAYLVGDATDDDVLERGGIKDAYGIFPVLSGEKDNLYLTVAARQKNPAIRIVASTADFFMMGKKLFKAGANAVISPNFIGGMRLVSEIARPMVTEFLDEMLRNRNADLHIYEVQIGTKSALLNKTLEASRIPELTGLVVIALLRIGETNYIYNPSADALLQDGDTVVVCGGAAQAEALKKLAANP